jgi:REP element-mobilizing transposase RayT
MARALRLEFEDALYHLCARGNRREQIFAAEKDYQRFEELLAQSLERYQVELHAYILLPNHFHLLARTLKPNLSRWMHWLITNYSLWFNRRHHMSGHVFQGRYKAFLVQEGNYLLGLSRYLHLNPVRGRIIGAGDPGKRRDRLRSYRWSSYRGYAGLTKQKDFVTEGLVLGEFGARSNSQKGKVSYRRFVEEGLLREIENPFEQLRWQTVLGDESFVRRLSDKLKSHRAHRREVTGVRRVLRATEPRVLVERVAKHYRIEIKKLLDEPAHGSEARNVAIWLLRQKGALTLREIGVLFGGIDYAAVSQRVRRVDQHMAKHKQLRKTCEILNV